MSERLAKVTDFLRQRGLTVAREVLVNFAAPFLIYDLGRHRWGDVHALMAASAPPLAWSAIEFIRRRRVDAISIFVIAGIALSLLAFIGGGSAKFLQLRENLVGGLIGLIFLGSAAIGKPLMYQVAHASMVRRSAEEAASFAARRDNPQFRHAMTFMTVVWGVGLLVQTAIACAMVMAMSIHDYLLVSPIVGYAFLGGLIGWTVLYGRYRQRRRERMEAAQDRPTEP
ncbi:MAG TPA: VC0807 family protein [Caulobacteraceae bacterium]